MRYTRRLTLLPAFLLMVVCAYGQDVHYISNDDGQVKCLHLLFRIFETHQCFTQKFRFPFVESLFVFHSV